ncbi:MAG: hypothetical protein U0894_14350 [Pirellulales bacterium]
MEWVVELKIDGVAISSLYENGLLTLRRHTWKRPSGLAYWRVRTIEDVPLRLLGEHIPPIAGGTGRGLHDQCRPCQTE